MFIVDLSQCAAWGATAVGFSPLGIIEFQFTRPQGARLFTYSGGKRRLLFQFTRPQGARPFASVYIEQKTKFQFTRPQGARQYMVLSIYFSVFATIFLRNTKNFYFLYCVFYTFFFATCLILICAKSLAFFAHL